MKSAEEVDDIGDISVFNAEVIDAEDEPYWTRSVGPKAGGEL